MPLQFVSLLGPTSPWLKYDSSAIELRAEELCWKVKDFQTINPFRTGSSAMIPGPASVERVVFQNPVGGVLLKKSLCSIKVSMNESDASRSVRYLVKLYFSRALR
ncbi:hypothetical protein B296_00013996 [Ensete ventricosum]|uniref:Uncharacterized protein n=1 Tax=Ensete ventricosum TaxID=4639 RepID=A0A426X7L4_ENSVE|nr:hypothetical protein B296_00013996 [Ensete ventricosum]